MLLVQLQIGGGLQLDILGMSEWKEFYICDSSEHKGLFKIENCKCNCASDLDDGVDINYIGAKKTENGFMKKVALDERLVTKGNCIVFICDGEGSVGYSNYQEDDFIGSTTLSVGYCESLTKYSGLFIVTLLDKEKYKFSYGRKYRNSFNSIIIKLPVLKDEFNKVIIDNNSPYSNDGYLPDWSLMESFIKSLPYGDRI